MSKSSSGSSSSMSSAESGSYRISPEDWEACLPDSPAREQSWNDVIDRKCIQHAFVGVRQGDIGTRLLLFGCEV